MSDWDDPLLALLELQRRFERGPKREGALAAWLTCRVALDVALEPGDGEKAIRRRHALLVQRVAALAVPRPLARGLITTLDHLQEGTPAGARVALAQLVAPVRDALGTEAGEAVAAAARLAHERGRDVSSRPRGS